MVARLLWEQDAAGSSPVTSTIILSNRIVMRFVFYYTKITRIISENFYRVTYSMFFLLPKQVGIYVYDNLNINAFEPSCILLYVEKSKFLFIS